MDPRAGLDTEARGKVLLALPGILNQVQYVLLFPNKEFAFVIIYYDVQSCLLGCTAV
jgi:hypothetical protein